MQTAKVFQTGGSQAVRIPKEFRFDESEVFIKRVEGGILLIPKQSHSEQTWRKWIEDLEAFHDGAPDDNDWLTIERGGESQKRDGMDEVFP